MEDGLSLTAMMMADEWPEMADDTLITIKPATELIFNGPFTPLPTKVQLKITNNSKQHAMLYKVKCTDNQKIKIRPCAGKLESKASKDIELERAPFQLTDSYAIDRDKIKVEYVLNSRPEEEPIRQLWERAKQQGVTVKAIKLLVKYNNKEEEAPPKK